MKYERDDRKFVFHDIRKTENKAILNASIRRGVLKTEMC